MKGQWTLILALVFALIVAIFAVINVNVVEVHYFFGTASWPLILVILGSALMGAFAVGAAGFFRVIQLQKERKQLQKEIELLRKQNDDVETIDQVNPVLEQQEQQGVQEQPKQQNNSL